MDLIKNWDKIRAHVRKCFRSNLHVAISSVDEDNHPTTTPIGSLFLNKDQTGFYFEKYTTKLPQNAQSNPHICILAVNSSKWFWAKALFRKKFSNYPAIQLYGQLGIRRKATPTELHALSRRVRSTRRLAGHQYLWGKMEYIREIHFTKAEMIKLGQMTQHL